MYHGRLVVGSGQGAGIGDVCEFFVEGGFEVGDNAEGCTPTHWSAVGVGCNLDGGNRRID
jgi:hypothetical protein